MKRQLLVPNVETPAPTDPVFRWQRSLPRAVASAGPVWDVVASARCSWLSSRRCRDLASRIPVRVAAESGQTRTDANDPNRTLRPERL